MKEGLSFDAEVSLDLKVYRCIGGAMLIVADAQRPELDRWYPKP